MESLFYNFSVLAEIRDFLHLGGNVLLFIGALSLVMWGLIFERLLYLRSEHQLATRAAIGQWEARIERTSWHAHQIRELLISTVSQGLERHMALIKTCVALCPLLGLMGTVTGMIEVFEVMAIAGSGNPRSMASGVSKATVPTMAGMVAALSGVAMSAYMQTTVRRERALLGEHMTMDH